MKIKGLTIGETIYSYNSKILEYKVIEIQTLKTEDHTEKFFILECQVCNGHTPCKIATKINNSGDLEYSHMINNYEIDDEYYESNEHHRNREYYWHVGDCFFRERKDARLYVHNKNIKFFEENIKKAEDSIEYNKKCIAQEEDKIKALLEI